MEIEGTVYSLLEPVRGQGARGAWVRQEMVIEYKSGDFNKKLSLSFWGDKAEQLSTVQQGERVKAYFDVESREYNGRWFTTAQVWKLERGPVAAAPNNIPPMDDLPYDDSYNEPF